MKRLAFALFLLAGSCLGSTDTADGTAPVIIITSPAGASVQGTVTFSATVVDDFGVDVVEFFAGNVSLLQDKVPPYEVSWNTVNFPDGEVQLRVIARDLSGNTSQQAKTVTVNNQPN